MSHHLGAATSTPQRIRVHSEDNILVSESLLANVSRGIYHHEPIYGGYAPGKGSTEAGKSNRQTFFAMVESINSNYIFMICRAFCLWNCPRSPVKTSSSSSSEAIDERPPGYRQPQWYFTTNLCIQKYSQHRSLWNIQAKHYSRLIYDNVTHFPSHRYPVNRITQHVKCSTKSVIHILLLIFVVLL